MLDFTSTPSESLGFTRRICAPLGQPKPFASSTRKRNASAFESDTELLEAPFHDSGRPFLRRPISFSQMPSPFFGSEFLKRLYLLLDLTDRQVAPVEAETAVIMSGVARPPLHVGTVGEFVVLVAITQNELSGRDDAIVIQGTGISNGLFEPGALFYPEAADHRLCKAIAKPERLAQSLFLIAFFFDGMRMGRCRS